MGKNTILTKDQTTVLNEVAKNELLRSNFYLTGGTALSEFYLQHRESVDLDFFTQNHFNQETILALFNDFSATHKFIVSSEYIDPLYQLLLKFESGSTLKVDFSYYPYKRIAKGNLYQGFEIDSLTDIAVNKLLTISQRVEVKDFVDLYFLLKNHSLWDLIHGVEIKFKRKIDPFILASDFTLAEDFDYLPKMLKPLTLDELKSFFRKEALELGKMGVE